MLLFIKNRVGMKFMEKAEFMELAERAYDENMLKPESVFMFKFF